MPNLLSRLQSQVSPEEYNQFLSKRAIVLVGLRQLFDEQLLVDPYLQEQVKSMGLEETFESQTAGAY